MRFLCAHNCIGSSNNFQLSSDDLGKLSVKLPQEIFSNFDTPTGLAFSVHASTTLFPLDDSLRDAGTVVGSPVVGAIVARSEEIAGLTQPVVVTLPITVKVCIQIHWIHCFRLIIIRLFHTHIKIFPTAYRP